MTPPPGFSHTFMANYSENEGQSMWAVMAMKTATKVEHCASET
jgi:hypothetical protein